MKCCGKKYIKGNKIFELETAAEAKGAFVNPAEQKCGTETTFHFIVPYRKYLKVKTCLRDVSHALHFSARVVSQHDLHCASWTQFSQDGRRIYSFQSTHRSAFSSCFLIKALRHAARLPTLSPTLRCPSWQRRFGIKWRKQNYSYYS